MGEKSPVAGSRTRSGSMGEREDCSRFDGKCTPFDDAAPVHADRCQIPGRKLSSSH